MKGDITDPKSPTNDKKIMNYENVLSLQIKSRPKLGNEILLGCRSCSLFQDGSDRAWCWSRIMLPLANTMGENRFWNSILIFVTFHFHEIFSTLHFHQSILIVCETFKNIKNRSWCCVLRCFATWLVFYTKSLQLWLESWNQW